MLWFGSFGLFCLFCFVESGSHIALGCLKLIYVASDLEFPEPPASTYQVLRQDVLPRLVCVQLVIRLQAS